MRNSGYDCLSNCLFIILIFVSRYPFLTIFFFSNPMRNQYKLIENLPIYSTRKVVFNFLPRI
uniref:Uncharacterized protein n=1 Tax=Rhizophora mucronata TaxID=61149 RepID=A0A2P2PNU3_RHIMU